MLPVSLDCPFLLPLRYSLTFICPVSCVPYVTSFSGLSFFIAFRYSLTFIFPVSCVFYGASFIGLSFFIAPSVFCNIYLPCTLCTLCCQFLWIVLFHCPFGNWFAMQGPVAIILISWNVIFIWETGYWTRAIKRFALFDLLKSLYSDINILSKYIPSLEKKL